MESLEPTTKGRLEEEEGRWPGSTELGKAWEPGGRKGQEEIMVRVHECPVV